MYKFEKMTEELLNTVANIGIEAYPGIDMTIDSYTERIRNNHNRPDVTYYTVKNDDGVVVGSYNMWDFEQLNFRGVPIKAGGIGSVAVGLVHKKQGIAKELLNHWLNELPKQGRNFAALYPFNSAFYYKMGFGFGTLMHQMRLKPADLPFAGGGKTHIRRLKEVDAQALADYYNAKVLSTHGLITKAVSEFETRLKDHQMKLFAYEDGGVIQGYMVFTFRRGSATDRLCNDMLVSEMFFDSPTVFAEFMAFCRSQADQIRYIIFNTQDEGFIYTIADARNHTENTFSSNQEAAKTGRGIMYRIVDFTGFVKDVAHVNFGNLNMVLKLNLNDSFMPQNSKSWLLEFAQGKMSIIEGKSHDAELSIGVAELASLLMGCNSLSSLIKYGQASLVDDYYLSSLNTAFQTMEKPICTTFF
ncbi:MAG: GNAT family N-acetyltransferase [Defluviitaleaceae bacterium]|nr:GNAT family N-acetyltransferase [Defluviitaleaceae bacterium]